MLLVLVLLLPSSCKQVNMLVEEPAALDIYWFFLGTFLWKNDIFGCILGVISFFTTFLLDITGMANTLDDVTPL